MDFHRNFCVVYIDNEDNSLQYYASQILRDKQKRSRSSSLTLTLDWRHSYTLNSLEEHRAFFDQYRLLLEPTFCQHEVLPTITTEEPSNFVQAFKGTNQVNFIKYAFETYDENRTFGILTDTFPHANLLSTTHVLRSVSSSATNNISNTIYRYLPIHCANVGPQVKGIYFEQYSSPVLAAPILCLIIAISPT